ncbi:hypothetical protein J1605_017411 [Eschrichtius robustus]|uniref:Uncharacterized protein n=1 Tax=Eschrichtius robustus TaxID=9764 RepID=A0AB34HXV6_ESCRO|nr:hypothetical protein J1605_017411 [Eschrichtius robustus]
MSAPAQCALLREAEARRRRKDGRLSGYRGGNRWVGDGTGGGREFRVRVGGGNQGLVRAPGPRLDVGSGRPRRRLTAPAPCRALRGDPPPGRLRVSSPCPGRGSWGGAGRGGGSAAPGRLPPAAPPGAYPPRRSPPRRSRPAAPPTPRERRHSLRLFRDADPARGWGRLKAAACASLMHARLQSDPHVQSHLSSPFSQGLDPLAVGKKQTCPIGEPAFVFVSTP